jgi:hypothetical protein
MRLIVKKHGDTHHLCVANQGAPETLDSKPVWPDKVILSGDLFTCIEIAAAFRAAVEYERDHNRCPFVDSVTIEV